VLADIADKRTPRKLDVELLRRTVPKLADIPVDELACHVVQLSKTAANALCLECQHLEEELAAMQPLHASAMERVGDSMSGPYEIYLALRNAESTVLRDLDLSRERLREHQREHGPVIPPDS
jgi:hypothetical protein